MIDRITTDPLVNKPGVVTDQNPDPEYVADGINNDRVYPPADRGDPLVKDEQATDLSATDKRPDPIEAKKKQFKAEQDARQKLFDRESNATITKMNRDKDFATARAERDGKIAARRQELQDMAFEHGVITQEQFTAQKGFNAPHAQQGVLLPHEVLARGEDTVLMAFPRTVILTLSADDVKRWNDSEPTTEDHSPVTHGSRVVFYQGYDDVPVGLADHPYLHDAGAYRSDKDGKPESVADREKRLSKAEQDKDKKDEAEENEEAEEKAPGVARFS